MAVRVLLVVAALGVLHGCGQASSPPERNTTPPTPKTSISARAPQKKWVTDAPALLGDEQIARLDDAGRKQLLACSETWCKWCGATRRPPKRK